MGRLVKGPLTALLSTARASCTERRHERIQEEGGIFELVVDVGSRARRLRFTLGGLSGLSGGRGRRLGSVRAIEVVFGFGCWGDFTMCLFGGLAG